MLKHIRGTLGQLKPEEVRSRADRPVRALIQSSSYAASRLERHLAPDSLSAGRQAEARSMLVREENAVPGTRYTLVFYEAGLQAPQGWTTGTDAFEFDPNHPQLFVRDVLAARDDLALALARRLTPFRDHYTHNLIQSVAKENALFSVMSALPNIIPTLADIPWAFGEFASDTAVLTVNQMRMAFLLAAACDQPIGFTEQRNEIGGLVAGAFGWRSLARELAGKIPFGGGLIPKAAIAYAGTWVAGISMERLYRSGYEMTRRDRKNAWDEALIRGRAVASQLLAQFKRQGEHGEVAAHNPVSEESGRS
jgi:hypothetical protein